MVMVALWNNLYLKPKNWLCGLQTDKVLHVMVSMILFQEFFFLTGKAWIAAVATFLVGLFKEVVVDKLICKECVDIDDLKADICGIALGAMMILSAYVLIYIHNLIW